MSKEYNFVFSAFVVLFLGCLFIFLSSRVVFDFIVCIGFCFFAGGEVLNAFAHDGRCWAPL